MKDKKKVKQQNSIVRQEFSQDYGVDLDSTRLLWCLAVISAQ